MENSIVIQSSNLYHILPSSSSEEDLSSLYDDPFVPSVFNIQTLNPFFLSAMHWSFINEFNRQTVKTSFGSDEPNFLCKKLWQKLKNKAFAITSWQNTNTVFASIQGFQNHYLFSFKSKSIPKEFTENVMHSSKLQLGAAILYKLFTYD